MPVRWSAELDQILLLKLLETHDITLKPNLICNAWPTGKGEVPTERAIREHLFKLRKDHGVKGKFVKVSLPSTPVKKEPASKDQSSPLSPGVKRKRNDEIVPITPSSMNSGSDNEREKTPTTAVKPEPEEDVIDLLSESETPTKRARRSTAPAPSSFGDWANSSVDRLDNAESEDEYQPGQQAHFSNNFTVAFDDEYA